MAACKVTVTGAGGWEAWACGRPARFVVRRGGDRSFDAVAGEDLPVCGVHVRWFRKHATELAIDEVADDAQAS